MVLVLCTFLNALLGWRLRSQFTEHVCAINPFSLPSDHLSQRHKVTPCRCSSKNKSLLCIRWYQAPVLARLEVGTAIKVTMALETSLWCSPDTPNTSDSETMIFFPLLMTFERQTIIFSVAGLK